MFTVPSPYKSLEPKATNLTEEVKVRLQDLDVEVGGNLGSCASGSEGRRRECDTRPYETGSVVNVWKEVSGVRSG